MAQIAAKYKVKLEKNREYPRTIFLNIQGRQIAYPNKFLDELFALKLNQVTSPSFGGEQEFTVGILRSIKQPTITSAKFEQARQKAGETFKTDVLQEYNFFLLEKNPVKVNEKVLKRQQSEQPEQE